MNHLNLVKATDAQLLLRFEQERDQRAFAELVCRHRPMVLATARRILGCRADAEDASQAVFLILAKSSRRIRDKNAVAGWLHRTTVRSAIDFQRVNSRWRTAAELGESVNKEKNVDENLRNPVQRVANEELASILDEEIARLPAKYQKAIVLCDLQGISQKAAAKQLGIAQQTVNDHISKGRRLLRDRLLRRGVALTLASMATCIASSGTKAAAETTAIAAAEIATKATRYAAGQSTAEIGVSSDVYQTANSVVLAMTKATFFSIGLAALAIVTMAGSINGLSGLTDNTVQAETLFIDDFSDGSITDDDPVTWAAVTINVGDATTGDGGLTLSPNGQTVLDGRQFAIGTERVVARDMSMRTQVRIMQDGDVGNLVGRVQPDSGLGYFATVGFDSNLGGSFLAVGIPRGFSAADVELIPPIAGDFVSLLPFDVRQQDALIQLDIIGNEIKAWAWRADSERPNDPLFQFTDDTYSEPGFPAIGSIAQNPTADLSAHGATFRFVHVATASIPEP